jgi:hypothetical protein
MVALLLALFVLAFPQAAQPPATAAPPSSLSANVWAERAAEIETYLATVRVERVVDLKIGVTNPKRAFVAAGGPVSSFAWKPLRPGRYSGYWESYRSEIAAYELDKLLGLGMVPVVVRREVNNEEGAAMMWLEGVRSWEEVQPLPKPVKWVKEIVRMKMFDDLIGNADRNKGNMLIDAAWNLYLIDHSRAFIEDRKLPQPLEHVDAALWDRMQALDEAMLQPTVGKWVGNRSVRAILQRRDALKKMIDDLVSKSGEQAVMLR